MPNLKAKGQDAKRTALLEIAISILEQEGAPALSMRRIAEQAGCSTTMLYTLFGGKDELVNALYLEGFRRLENVLHTVQNLNPLGANSGIKSDLPTFCARASGFLQHYV
jgi:AcrR family transcriptional regulator